MKKVQIPILKDIDDTEKEEMLELSCLKNVQYSKNEVIFHTGDTVNEIGIVLKGRVNIENIDIWGNKSILSCVSEGEIFAETYAICGEPMMVDAVAAEKSEIQFLNLKALIDEKNSDKGWYVKLISNMLKISVRKNLALSGRIFCTSSKTIRGRLLTYLSNISVKSGSKTFQIPFDRQQLADYLNLDRSALSKELGKMRDEGLIEFHKNVFKLIA